MRMNVLISDKKEYQEYLQLIELRDQLQKQVDAQIMENMEDIEHSAGDVDGEDKTLEDKETP